MKSRVSMTVFQFALIMSCDSVVQAMDKGPMNSDWFYNEKNSFNSANQLHQNKEWEKATKEYRRLLDNNVGDAYDQNMARLNMAACLMAQRKKSDGWGSFDRLLGIDPEHSISKELIAASNPKTPKKVLVRTDKIGIGDIFHFLKAAAMLKEKTDWDITVSVRNVLKGTLADAVKNYKLKLVGEEDEQPPVALITHIIGLLGHLEMDPGVMNPDKVLFTSPEKAMNAVSAKIDPILHGENTIAVVFLGEDRQATLIGGKQLPRDPKEHGRHLSSTPFVELLKKNKKLTLMDCGTKTSRVSIESDQKDQYVVIPDEEQPFDTLVALARVMSCKKSIIAFGADNGPTNVFARSIHNEAQNRMAFIIPNGNECDMRMEGEGKKYKHMISNCLVYRCTSPEKQTQVIESAYNDMIS